MADELRYATVEQVHELQLALQQLTSRSVGDLALLEQKTKSDRASLEQQTKADRILFLSLGTLLLAFLGYTSFFAVSREVTAQLGIDVKKNIQKAKLEIDSILVSARANADTIDKLKSLSPLGMISGFTAQSCPNGWSPFVEGQSRFLRGLANNTVSKSVGGNDYVVLSTAQLPAHQHTVSISVDDGISNHAPFGVGATITQTGQPTAWASTPRPTMKTSIIGGGERIPIVPSFVSVLFCERK